MGEHGPEQVVKCGACGAEVARVPSRARLLQRRPQAGEVVEEVSTRCACGRPIVVRYLPGPPTTEAR